MSSTDAAAAPAVDAPVVAAAAPLTPEQITSKAKILYIVAAVLCLTAVVIQIVAASTKDGEVALLYGTQVITEGRVPDDLTSRVGRSYGAWETCQNVQGRLVNTKTGCMASESKDCTSLQQRIVLVQASGVIGVIFSGLAFVPILLGALGGSVTTNVLANQAVLAFSFIAMAFNLVLWSVVANMKYSTDYLCNGTMVLTVKDKELFFGSSFALVVAAWILLLIQFVLAFLVKGAIAPAVKPAPELATEPTAVTSA